MTIVRNHAKERLRAGDPAIGFGVHYSRTANVAAIAKQCGFDWLFIDMEHGSMDVDHVVQLCVAALPVGITPVVRVPGHQHFHAARVLDGGALGVVVPHVSTLEEARQVVRNCKFPPAGHRSMTSTLPHFGYATPPAAEAAVSMNDAVLVIVMLETPEAIENADAIAALDGIDSLLIGTNDLTAEMGIPGQFGHEKARAAYKTTIAACRKHGKHAGMGGVTDHALMQEYIQMGVRLVLGGSDLSFLMAAAKARTEFLRSISLDGG